MRPIVLSALLLAGCPATPPGDTADTADTDTGTDSDSGDTGTDTDTGADTGDTDTGADTGDTDTGTAPAPTPRELARRWKLVWEDEFDGPATAGDPCYDAAQTPPRCMNRYWSQEPCDEAIYANIADLNKCTWVLYDIYNWMDWGKPLEGHGINKLDQTQVRVEDGILHLTAEPVTDITWEPGDAWPWNCGVDLPDYLVSEDCPIVAGGIHSNPDFAPVGYSKTYGRFEVKAIIPNQMGSWPAHWLLPEGGDWPDDGEIDIMEAVAHDPSTVIGTFHSGDWFNADAPLPDGTHVHQGLGHLHDPGEPRYASGWHVYAVEWEPTQLRFFVDDLEYGHIEDGWLQVGDVLWSNEGGVTQGQAWPEFPFEIPSMPFYFILNTSIVPTGGFSLKDFAPLDHLIDWVRVYTPCTETDTDPACVQRSTGSADVTRHAWMSGAKWSDQYRVLHTGDFDGDGDDDVLLRTRSAGHATYLLRGQPRGDLLHEETLTTANGMSEAAWSDVYRAGHVGDFDGDGADDLLLQGRTTGDDTFLLLADGTGGFDAPVTLTNAAGQSGSKWDAGSHDLVVGDFDGNGKDDVLLVPRTAAHQARLLLADGAGGFATGQVVTNDYGLDGSKWTAQNHVPLVVDLDGDGQDDVLLQQRTAVQHTRWLRGGPTGFQGTATDLTSAAGLDYVKWAADTHQAHVGDFDGDGKGDVLLQGDTSGDDSWLVRGGTGGIADAGSVFGMFGISAGDWSGARHVAHVGDLNGDRKDDVLLRSASDAWGTIAVFGGTGGFASARDVTDEQDMGPPQWSDETQQGALIDLDGDHRDDVFLRGRSQDDKTFVIYLP